jgi:hypothetical protein
MTQNESKTTAETSQNVTLYSEPSSEDQEHFPGITELAKK